MVDDSELLRRYVDLRSNEAFAELVRRHIKLVFSAAHRRVGGDAHLAEDVTQIVFTALAKKAPALLEHPSLAGWLHRSTHYAAVDALREQRRHARHDERAALMIEELGGSGGADENWQQMAPILDSLIDQLSRSERDALVLRYFEGYSFTEISASLRISEDAARMRANRGLERLRTMLRRRGITSTAGALGLALSGPGVVAAPTALAPAIASAALAGVVNTGSVGVLSAFEIMGNTKFIAGATTLVAILSLGIAVRQTIALREARSLVAAISATPRLALSETGTLLSGSTASRNDSYKGSAERRRDDSGKSERSQVKPTNEKTVVVHMADILKENPDFASTYRKDTRRNIIRIYGGFLGSLNLPPEELRKLEDLLAERAMSSMDAQLAAEASGLERGTPPWQDAMTQARHEVESEINSILETYAHLNLEALKDQMNLQHQIENDYGPDFIDAGIPVSPAQYRSLTQIFRDGSAPANGLPVDGSIFTRPDPATGLSAQDKQILAKASEVLTPAQIEILKNSRAEAHQREAVMSKYYSGEQRITIKTP